MNLTTAVTFDEERVHGFRFRAYAVDGRQLGQLTNSFYDRRDEWKWKMEPEAAADFPNLAALAKRTVTPDLVMAAIASDVQAAMEKGA